MIHGLRPRIIGIRDVRKDGPMPNKPPKPKPPKKPKVTRLGPGVSRRENAAGLIGRAQKSRGSRSRREAS